jgi:archaea-specific DNA-binding protein
MTEESNERIEGVKVPIGDSIDAGSKDEKVVGKDNIIFVGIKPFMNYVTGVVMQFQNKGQNEVIVSARGKFISKAVDVVEVARRTFLKDEDIQVKDIGINSEQFENKEGKRIFVSTIEIKLIKG